MGVEMVQIVSLIVHIERLRTEEQLIQIYIARLYKRRLFPLWFKLGLFSFKKNKTSLPGFSSFPADSTHAGLETKCS